MRKISPDIITEKVRDALIKSNYSLDDSFVGLLKKARDKESDDLSRSILDDILENQEIAKTSNIPLCQDTGIVVVFAQIGREVLIEGDLDEFINDGVRQAYDEGYLRKSIVDHPFERRNTMDNTPAIIHTKIVEGDKLTLTIAAKGAGSENMSKVIMLKPTDGVKGVKAVVKDAIFKAGGKPCPPIIVGIGIGGNLEKSALLAKEALFRDLDDKNSDASLAKLEQELYEEINALGVGPMGVGGDTTCLGVKINTYPMHIASLPVAINIQCHANRHERVVI